MGKNKSIEKELEELTTIYERGGGLGAPEAERELERRIDFLKHKQIQVISKSNIRIAILNVLLVAINVGVLVYQVVFK